MAKRTTQLLRRKTGSPQVGIIMGSKSDLETMRHAADVLDELGLPYEILVVSAHRTPDWLFTYAQSAEVRGLQVIIAGAGGAAHLPGMAASKTVVPVLGVPVESRALKGLDSLLSIAQMPAGVPVGTLAIGKAGAINAGLLAAAIVSNGDPALRRRLAARRARQTKTIMQTKDLKNEIRRLRKA
jgi:5-(carboxyamino)imidazole ribonucleotide mutase